MDENCDKKLLGKKLLMGKQYAVINILIPKKIWVVTVEKNIRIKRV